MSILPYNLSKLSLEASFICPLRKKNVVDYTKDKNLKGGRKTLWKKKRRVRDFLVSLSGSDLQGELESLKSFHAVNLHSKGLNLFSW